MGLTLTPLNLTKLSLENLDEALKDLPSRTDTRYWREHMDKISNLRDLIAQNLERAYE